MTNLMVAFIIIAIALLLYSAVYWAVETLEHWLWKRQLRKRREDLLRHYEQESQYWRGR